VGNWVVCGISIKFKDKVRDIEGKQIDESQHKRETTLNSVGVEDKISGRKGNDGRSI